MLIKWNQIKENIYNWTNQYSLARKIYKAQWILRHEGFINLWKSIRKYIKKRHLLKVLGIKEEWGCESKDEYKSYDSEYEADEDFSQYKADVKLLAFYLPQFHTIPENDEWWGKGFTEWTNTKSSTPRFEGHYQPRIPHPDIGYYCLDDINVLKKQAELAKRHGIFGFCFYYYWFSGKRLLEKPVDMLLEHSEIDLPFCLCWANENWTRRWDGQNQEILIKQEYNEEDDEKFIIDIKKYVEDPRYIRIDGKPIIIVYNAGEIPNCHKSFKKWREVAQRIGLGEILIWTCQTANNTAQLLKIEDCIDAEVEFPPHNLWMDPFAVSVKLESLGSFYSYQRIVKYIEKKLVNKDTSKIPIHHSCMMAWDNAARRKNGWVNFCAFSLQNLYKWMLAILERTRNDFLPEERFAFINAWNEWGEGTYLEPDEKYGYANINTVSKALFNLPISTDLKVLNHNCPLCEKESFEIEKKPRIAVQIHIFYLDVLEEIITWVNHIPYSFDCFITTDTKEKQTKISEIMLQKCHCKKYIVQVMLNRGRDVAPFLVQLAPFIDQYDYVCHIHSKKTLTNEHGNEWRKYIFEHLIGSEEYIKRIFYLFEQDKHLGIIFPETYPVLELQNEWGGNKEGVQYLLEKMQYKCVLPSTPIFPLGNMFWARSAAVYKVFHLGLTQLDFPIESGQVNNTLAHQIERSWVYMAKSEGYSYCKVFNNVDRNIICQSKKRIGIFVHYDAQNIISNDDIETLRIFSCFFTRLIFVSNSELNEKELDKVRPMAFKIKLRKNVGFDFGAWQDVLMDCGKEALEKYDELVLLNNSFFPPVYDIRKMFFEMERKNIDFWGCTVFPHTPDGTYIHSKYIPEHLQSYFLVFNKNVIKSDAFWDFWRRVLNYGNLTDVVRNCESQITKYLFNAGFSYEPYIKETFYLSRFLKNYAIPYEKPTSLLLLGNPFVKKKCFQYMSVEEKVKLQWLLLQMTK